MGDQLLSHYTVMILQDRSFYVLLLVLTLCFVRNSLCAVDDGVYTCVHDATPEQVKLSFQNYDNTRKKRQNQPFRVAVHYDDSLNTEITAEARTRLQDDVMPQVVDFFSSALSARIPLTDPILLNRDCNNGGSFFITPEPERPCGDQCEGTTLCLEAQVPADHLRQCVECNGVFQNCGAVGDPDGPGVANADFVLYVSTRQVGPCIPPTSTIAFAGCCAREQMLDRPIAGNANFCPNGILDFTIDELVDTAKHEVMHALVFSSSLYPFFRNDDGTPQTPRDDNGFPEDMMGNTIISENTVKKLTYDNWQTRDGTISHNVTAVVTPTMLVQGALHYGCSEFLGAELESQDTSSGLAPSHWEIRTFGNELMTAISQANSRLSRLTLALFQDSGWYNVDFSVADEHAWGRQSGCEFAHRSCGEWITSRVASGESLLPFCNTLNSEAVTSCTVDRLRLGRCNLVEFTSTIPPQYRYFTDPVLGGSFSIADYCPIVDDFGTQSDCANTALPLDTNTRAETYGPGSRCMEAGSWTRTIIQSGQTTTNTNFRSGCYEYSCSNQTGLTIMVLGNSFTCIQKGAVLDIDITVSGVRYMGTLVCPSCAEMCYDELINCPSGAVCSPTCQNGGLCSTTNTCNCTGTGYIGDQCQTPVCSPTCQNGGLCSAPNACNCTGTGYMGDQCQTPVCNPTCQNRGLCSAPNTCNCTGTGYMGDQCETLNNTSDDGMYQLKPTIIEDRVGCYPSDSEEGRQNIFHQIMNILQDMYQSSAGGSGWTE